MSTALMAIAGLAVLSVGAELLIRGASALAVAARISPLVVGLTVVAYGTSTPELVVSVQASLEGRSEIALGNVVGSNIFNVLFILGLSALIVPLQVSRQLVRIEAPLLVAVSLVVGAMALDGRIGLVDGVLLTSGLLAYTTWGIRRSRRESAAADAAGVSAPARPGPGSSLALNLGLVAGGLALLVLGGRWFIDAATEIARGLGMSEFVIGLTVVAAGTSLPEVATSVTAALRGQRDIAVGNVIGSNLFNLLGVLGLSGILSETGLVVTRAALELDLPVMIATAVACLPIFFTGHVIARWEGAVFLGYCGAYTGSLVVAASRPEWARTLEVVLLGFVVPLTVLTLAVTTVRSWRERRT